MILPVSVLFPTAVSADVNIAVIAPLSGEYQKLGQEVAGGVKIAVDEINADGGLKGEKINLVTVDDPCNDLLAISTAQMIAVNSSPKDKMNLVIGPFCANSFTEAANIYANAKIMQIVPTPVSETNMKNNHKSLITTVAKTQQQSHDFFKYYLKNLTDKKVALVYDSRLKDVVETAAVMQEEFRKAGKLLDFKSFNFNNYNKDYERLAEDIIDEKYEVAYIIGTAKEVSRLAGELKNEDSDFIIFADRYQVGEKYLEELGSLANGSYFLALPSLKDNPEFTETLVKLRLLGVEPEGLSVYSYAVVKLWEEMVKKSNSFAYDKLTEVVENNSYPTVWGEIAFESGRPKNVVNYSIYLLNDGEYTQVY